MDHDELLRKIVPGVSVVKKAGWLKQFLRPGVKTAQIVRPDDVIARSIRERLVTDEIVDDPQDRVIQDMGRLVSQQQQENQGLQMQTMSAAQAAAQAQQVIQQLQGQVQQLSQQAGHAQQVLSQAQQMQAQMGAQVSQATAAAVQAGDQAVMAQMEAFNARRSAQQQELAWQQYKERLRQTIEADPTQQALQQQAMQMQAMQMQQAAMQQQQGQPGQQEQPDQQAPEQAQQPGMQVVASLADARRRSRRDGGVAIKLAIDLGQVASTAKEVREAVHTPAGAAVSRLIKDLQRLGAAATSSARKAGKEKAEEKTAGEKTALHPQSVARVARIVATALKGHPRVAAAAGGTLLLGGLLGHRYTKRQELKAGRPVPRELETIRPRDFAETAAVTIPRARAARRAAVG